MPDAGHGEHSLLLSSSWSIILPCHMSSSNILVESMQFHAAPCEEQQKRQEAEPSIGDLQPDLMSYWCAEPIRLSAYEATNSENIYAMQMLMAVAAPRVSQQAGSVPQAPSIPMDPHYASGQQVLYCNTAHTRLPARYGCIQQMHLRYAPCKPTISISAYAYTHMCMCRLQKGRTA